MSNPKRYAGQDEHGNFQSIDVISSNMRVAETVDDQLTCSLGLPCLFDNETNRYYLTGTAARALKAARDAAEAPPFKLISSEELKVRLERIKKERLERFEK
jgi:hypothetical protein